MKKLFLVLTALSLPLAAQAAPSRYCNATQRTTTRIDQVRIVDLPYPMVQREIINALVTDRCVRSRLSNPEIYTLTQMLLDYNNSQDTAGQIIGEFMAQ